MQLLFIIPLLGLAWGRRNPMENPDLYQGDIAGIDLTLDRNGVPYKSMQWPGGIIPYKLDDGVSHIETRIKRAMRQFETKTCLKFVERTSQTDYIRIFSGEGCYSHWGRTGGAQPVSLGDGCEPLGTVIHELNHAVGFDHEQNRSDRDDYLTIYWENIMSGMEDQFDKLKPSHQILYSPFDYNSIMLYGERSFSKDRISKTMVAKDSSVRLVEPYDKPGLSYNDITRIKLMYHCH